MEGFSPDKKRSFVLLSHAQAGKTTLSEALLAAAGAISRKGSIAEGNTISDYTDEEKARKVSVSASLMNFKYKGNFVQMIDTPGYADFIGDVVSSMRAADAAIVVIDAFSGIEVGTERVWEMLDNLNLPRLIFINKLDKENTDLNKSLNELKGNLSKNAILIQNPLSSENIETIAESSDTLLEKYLEGKEIPQEELKSALKQAVSQGKIYPVFSGSALSDKGIKELLEAIIEYLPSPLERQKVTAKDLKIGQDKEVAFSESAPLSGLVFKTVADPYVGQLSLIKIFSGKLQTNTSFYNITKSSKERFSQIYCLQGKEQRPINEASCGDIIAIAKLKDTHTNDSIGSETELLVFDPIVFPDPIYSASIKPKTRQDEDKISVTLAKITSEDHTFKVTRDTQTKEMIISGMGDQHLNVMVERMKKRFNVEVDLGTPKVPYKETLTKVTKVQGKYKKQSGGRGQYGDVWLEVAPLARGGDFEFVDKVVGGAIPRNYIPSVEKGVKNAMLEGVVAGYPFVDVRVTLYDGSYHDVDSSDIAFQIAGRMAFRKAVLEAGPVLLEPIMDVEVAITEEFMGQISGDINSRRGRVMGMDSRAKYQILKAQVPLAEMFTYAADLRSMTGGRGMYSMSFSHYEIVPPKITQDIIAKYQQTKKQEE
ncbi:MAG: elongation factor G [Candidatus Omnitrophica bacterium]|nr:elongation factor G [Candidatus Omnitrophota bacterium]